MKDRQFGVPSFAVSALLLAVMLFLTGSAAAAQATRSLTPLPNASIVIQTGTSPNTLSSTKLNDKTSSRRGLDNEKTLSSSGSSIIAVVSTNDWVNTGVQLNIGATLVVTATGAWSPNYPNEPMVGPDGSPKPWWDNYLNVSDIGSCPQLSCSTAYPSWAALIGYIGSAPPPPGSYLSASILPQAQKVFVVGSNFFTNTVYSGTLWLGFNDDAYSASNGDNAGSVTAVISGLPTYSISGQVVDNTNAPFAGANISDGWGDTATTDGNGNYTFSGLLARTYKLTPSAGGYAFSPASLSVSVPPDASSENFTASPILPTTTTVTSLVNPSVGGQPVTFTAIVTSISGIPTGQVTFKDSGSVIGAANLNNAGAATLTTSALSVGSRTITVEYSGATTFYASSSNPLAQTVENDDLGIQLNGWRGLIDSKANGDTYRMSKTQYDTATFKCPRTSVQCTGTSVTWVTKKGPDQGKAQVLIDGLSKGTFDLYAASAQPFQKSFGGLANKSHTVIIKVLGTKNMKATSTNVTVDAFIVNGITTQDDSPLIQYNNWVGGSNWSASGGTYRSSNTSSAVASFYFNGTSVDWITAKGPGYGKARVFIDGILRKTVDLYSGAKDWDCVIPFQNLGPGKHTIQIKVLGTKNASSTGTTVVVDGFIYPITTSGNLCP